MTRCYQMESGMRIDVRFGADDATLQFEAIAGPMDSDDTELARLMLEAGFLAHGTGGAVLWVDAHNRAVLSRQIALAADRQTHRDELGRFVDHVEYWRDRLPGWQHLAPDVLLYQFGMMDVLSYLYRISAAADGVPHAAATTRWPSRRTKAWTSRPWPMRCAGAYTCCARSPRSATRAMRRCCVPC